MIKLCKVSFSYGVAPVLHGVDFTLREGERIALMGASGSGKTTLLRLTAGLERPASGTLAGIPKEGVSMVFQENRLLPQLTALGNLALVKPAASRRELTALLGELGLADQADVPPDKLSGGMKRRVAIARAIAFGSPLVLLDEPFSGLDEQMRAQTADFILRHTAGAMLLLVTHDPQEAALLDARVMDLASLQLPRTGT